MSRLVPLHVSQYQPQAACHQPAPHEAAAPVLEEALHRDACRLRQRVGTPQRQPELAEVLPADTPVAEAQRATAGCERTGG